MDAYLKQLFDDQVAAVVNKEGLVVIETLTTSPLAILRDDTAAYTESFTQWRDSRRETLLSQVEQILKIGNNYRNFLGLQRFYGEGSVVAFIGAGMSRPSGFPLWGELLDGMCNEIGISDEEFAQMMRNGAYEDAVQRIVDERGESWMWTKIFHSYQSFEPESIDGPVNYVPQMFTQGVFTTNFDNVLERCYESQGKDFSNVCTRSSPDSIVDFLNDGANFLYKLHGTFEDPSSRVLARVEYDAAYGNAAFVETLRHLFTTKKVLFLGCGLASDRTMEFLLELIKTHPYMGPHYAFLSLPKQDWEKRSKETFLAARGISPIWYDGDHDACLTALLEKLMI